VVVTEAVLAHPAVAALLEGVTQEAFEATLKGIAAPQKLWRLRPKRIGEVVKSAAGGGT
jgi:class 3 adenylate cyclase